VNIRVREGEYNNTCWRDVVLGFPKSEYNVTPGKWSGMLLLPCEYPLEAYSGFREHMITEFCGRGIVERHCEPDSTRPRVIVVFRNATMRDIDHKQELGDAIRGWCPHCSVDTFIYANHSYCAQMRHFCNASIVISMHGSQLSHMVWMKVNSSEKKTAVIEILPYMYTCRNWYEQIAKGAEIKYFKWVNTHLENTRSGRPGSPLYQKCIDGDLPCLGDCHDFLRDQPTVANLTEFEDVFIAALSHVSKIER
jgi:hypothetical protein